MQPAVFRVAHVVAFGLVHADRNEHHNRDQAADQTQNQRFEQHSITS